MLAPRAQRQWSNLPAALHKGRDCLLPFPCYPATQQCVGIVYPPSPTVNSAPHNFTPDTTPLPHPTPLSVAFFGVHYLPFVDSPLKENKRVACRWTA